MYVAYSLETIELFVDKDGIIEIAISFLSVH